MKRINKNVLLLISPPSPRHVENVENHMSFCYFSECRKSNELYLKISWGKNSSFSKQGVPLHGKFYENIYFLNPSLLN